MKSFKARGVAGGALLALPAALLLGAPGTAGDKREGPDGSLRARQQALFDRVNVRGAWRVTKGDAKVTVGVIDSGFDFFHPDLRGQLIPGYYYPGGYHPEVYENIAHGTQVCSIIAARGEDPSGMVGLAPGCKVLTASQGMIEHTLVKLQLRFFREHPKASAAEWQKEMQKHQEALKRFGTDWVHYQVTNAADAVRYLVDRGVKVINISGGLKKSLCPSAELWQRLEDAFAHAARKGVVIVLAAGNNAARWEDYPGSPDTVVVVGATRLDDTRWEEEVDFRGMKLKQGSNFGKRLTVMAPAEKVVVCQPHDRRMYAAADGPMGPTKVEFKGGHQVVPMGATSCAAPVVTALVALLYSARPDLDARSVVEFVKRGCDDIGERGHDLHTGYGRVNFGKSLTLALDRGK
jgi:subtilisin family serine protease